MAGTITTALSNAFKVQLLKGNHDFDTSMRVILLKEEENLSTNYGAATVSSGSIGTDEVSHSSYDAVLTGAESPGYSRNVQGVGGGAYVTIASTYPKLGSDGTTAEIDFQDAVFSNVTVAADGCVLYNSNASLHPARQPVFCVWHNRSALAWSNLSTDVRCRSPLAEPARLHLGALLHLLKV